jgi:glycosyltransferase involved in cell wall biosynthesis
MKVAVLTTDNREHYKDYGSPTPYFGTAPEALLQGFADFPDLEVHVVSCARQQLSSPPKLAPNIHFHTLFVPKLGWMTTGYQGCIRAVRRKLAQIRPDLVHGQGTEKDCAISAVLSGYPNVVTIHGNVRELARLFQARVGSFMWLAARIEDFTLKRTAGVFCHSEYTEGLVRPRTRRTWRVANPLRKAFFDRGDEPAPSGKHVLLNVGLVSPRKQQLELLTTVQELAKARQDFEFQFVGDAYPNDPYADEFLSRLRPLEEMGVARYVGTKSTAELIRAFDSASGLVHFPMEEAFGLVAAEALARNLALFVSRVGGLKDIADGVPGAELVDPEDWAGLAARIREWLERGAPRSRAAAAIMRERYEPVVIARRHVQIYQEVLAR